MVQTVISGTKTKVFCVLLAVILSTFSSGFADTMVRFDTVLGNFHLQLSDTVTPLTVQNFLNYVTDGDYVNSFFHRMAWSTDEFGDPIPFVLQGGGFTYEADQFGYVPTDPPVQNEFNVSNTYGTIAMAKTAEGPDTATCQFFFNLGDNSANLDNQNGGFTVFGEVMGIGMDVVNLLAAQQVWDASSFHSAFGEIPLIDYDPDGTIPWPETLEMIYAVTVVIQGDANSDGVVSAGDYAEVQANFGNTGDVGIPGDANFDGVVSAGDFAMIQANFGNTAPLTMTPAPEPATLFIMGCGIAGLLRKGRRV